MAPILNSILWQNECLVSPSRLRYRCGAGEMTISFPHEIRRSPVKFLWLTIYLAGLLWSAANPHDYFTWILEAFPALIGLAVLAATRKHFPLTPLAYGLILLHCWILFLGAHYTYAEVNTFRFIRDLFGWQRNNYDKLGHFAQGFVPAIIAREICFEITSSVIAAG